MKFTVTFETDPHPRVEHAPHPDIEYARYWTEVVREAAWTARRITVKVEDPDARYEVVLGPYSSADVARQARSAYAVGGATIRKVRP